MRAPGGPRRDKFPENGGKEEKTVSLPKQKETALCVSLSQGCLRDFQGETPKKSFHSETSVWTVDLLTPNFRAAARTVARFSIMYWARRSARSSIFPFKELSLPVVYWSILCTEKGRYARRFGGLENDGNEGTLW